MIVLEIYMKVLTWKVGKKYRGFPKDWAYSNTSVHWIASLVVNSFKDKLGNILNKNYKQHLYTHIYI